MRAGGSLKSEPHAHPQAPSCACKHTTPPGRHRARPRRPTPPYRTPPVQRRIASMFPLRGPVSLGRSRARVVTGASGRRAAAMDNSLPIVQTSGSKFREVLKEVQYPEWSFAYVQYDTLMPLVSRVGLIRKEKDEGLRACACPALVFAVPSARVRTCACVLRARVHACGGDGEGRKSVRVRVRARSWCAGAAVLWCAFVRAKVPVLCDEPPRRVNSENLRGAHVVARRRRGGALAGGRAAAG